jgi:hypothetical protein
VLPNESAADREYIEELWYLMHHCENGDEAMTFLTSYYDDSGSDDLSPVTAIGGPVMLKEACTAFNIVWLKLLEQYRVFGPLHMTDFVRPHGKHIGMHFELKLALFSEIARLINEYKVYSVSVGIPQPDFRAAMPEEVRKELIGPYALAFLLRRYDKSRRGPSNFGQRNHSNGIFGGSRFKLRRPIVGRTWPSSETRGCCGRVQAYWRNWI